MSHRACPTDLFSSTDHNRETSQCTEKSKEANQNGKVLHSKMTPWPGHSSLSLSVQLVQTMLITSAVQSAFEKNNTQFWNLCLWQKTWKSFPQDSRLTPCPWTRAGLWQSSECHTRAHTSLLGIKIRLAPVLSLACSLGRMARQLQEHGQRTRYRAHGRLSDPAWLLPVAMAPITCDVRPVHKSPGVNSSPLHRKSSNF
jgi:hypothetical protein